MEPIEAIDLPGEVGNFRGQRFELQFLRCRQVTIAGESFEFVDERSARAHAESASFARDQFLAITLKADGTPVEPSFLENFESLRTTGDWE